MMRLTLNGEPLEVPDELVRRLDVERGDGRISVRQLLDHLELTGPVAVEVNHEIVPRAEHASRTLADGDVLEVVHFVGGG
jgi:sulfur carrier protein